MPVVDGFNEDTTYAAGQGSRYIFKERAGKKHSGHVRCSTILPLTTLNPDKSIKMCVRSGRNDRKITPISYNVFQFACFAKRYAHTQPRIKSLRSTWKLCEIQLVRFSFIYILQKQRSQLPHQLSRTAATTSE